MFLISIDIIYRMWPVTYAGRYRVQYTFACLRAPLFGDHVLLLASEPRIVGLSPIWTREYLSMDTTQVPNTVSGDIIGSGYPSSLWLHIFYHKKYTCF